MLLQDPLKLLSVVGVNLMAGIASRKEGRGGRCQSRCAGEHALGGGSDRRNSSGHEATLRKAGEIHTQCAMAAAYF
jgi:hypothetical protein